MRRPPRLPLLAVLLAGCRTPAKAPEPSPYRVEGDVVIFADAAAEAATVAVERADQAADDHLRVTGRLTWDEDVTGRVFPPVAGRVARINVDLGSRVGEGTVLAFLSSPDYGQVQADAARAAADRTAAERALERARELHERGATPRKDLEQAEAEAERTRAEFDRTQARLLLWGGEGRRPGSVDQDFHLVSPVSGLVVERNLNPGQEVRADTQTPLFAISDPRRLWVALDITEKDLGEIAKGASLRIHSPAFPDRTFWGILDVVGAALDSATRTVRARGRVENPDGLLKAEMYVSVEVARAGGAPRQVLPARAVIQDGTDRFVFVQDGAGRYRRVSVSVGMESEGFVRVLSGLRGDAHVVTEGSLLLEAAWAEGRKS